MGKIKLWFFYIKETIFLLFFGDPGFLLYEGSHKILDDSHREVAIRYKEGAVIASKDEYLVDKMMSLGEMTLCVIFKDDVARLTTLGKQTLRRDTICKNPVASLLYRIKASTY